MQCLDFVNVMNPLFALIDLIEEGLIGLELVKEHYRELEKCQSLAVTLNRKAGDA